MKRLTCLLIASCLVLGILLIAVADVNHGHGPGYHAENGDGHGESHDDGHAVDAHGHDESHDSGHAVDSHGQSESHDGEHAGDVHDDGHSNVSHGPPEVVSH